MIDADVEVGDVVWLGPTRVEVTDHDPTRQHPWEVTTPAGTTLWCRAGDMTPPVHRGR